MRNLLRLSVTCSILLLCLLISTYQAEASQEEEQSEEIAEESAEEGTISEETPLYEQLIETAIKLKGVKYKYAGTSPETGFDCSGFTTYVFAQYGIDLPRSSSDMYALGEAVKRSELRAGDLVFFNTSGNKISHVGIYIGNNQFIHSSTKRGVIITSLDDPHYWSKRYVGAKRIL